MDRRQKVWLGIFGAMFLVPEILWGGVVGQVIYYWLLNGDVRGGIRNFAILPLPQSANLTKFIYLTEFIVVAISFINIIFFYHTQRKLLKLLKFLLGVVLGLLLFVALFFVMFIISIGNL